MRNGQAYHLLNNLSGLILPILRVDVSCCNFSSLLLGTTPWELYVGELVVRVKDYEDNKLIYIYSKENPYQVLEQNQASDQALNNTFLSLQGHQWEHLHTGHILEHPFLLPSGLEFFKSRKSTPEGWLPLGGEVFLNFLWVLSDYNQLRSPHWNQWTYAKYILCTNEPNPI